MKFDEESAKYVDALNICLSGYMKLVNQLETKENEYLIRYTNSLLSAHLKQLIEYTEIVERMRLLKGN